jgi:hypothetical protein
MSLKCTGRHQLKNITGVYNSFEQVIVRTPIQALLQALQSWYSRGTKRVFFVLMNEADPLYIEWLTFALEQNAFLACLALPYR